MSGWIIASLLVAAREWWSVSGTVRQQRRSATLEERWVLPPTSPQQRRISPITGTRCRQGCSTESRLSSRSVDLTLYGHRQTVPGLTRASLQDNSVLPVSRQRDDVSAGGDLVVDVGIHFVVVPDRHLNADHHLSSRRRCRTCSDDCSSVDLCLWPWVDKATSWRRPIRRRRRHYLNHNQSHPHKLQYDRLNGTNHAMCLSRLRLAWKWKATNRWNFRAGNLGLEQFDYILCNIFTYDMRLKFPTAIISSLRLSVAYDISRRRIRLVRVAARMFNIRPTFWAEKCCKSCP